MPVRGVIQSPVLVGRDDFLTLMEGRLADAAAGAGQLLFVAGEAGIGKTRLLGSIARHAHASGPSVPASPRKVARSGSENIHAIAGASRRAETLIFGPADFSASLKVPELTVGRLKPEYPGDYWHYFLARVVVVVWRCAWRGALSSMLRPWLGGWGAPAK